MDKRRSPKSYSWIWGSGFQGREQNCVYLAPSPFGRGLG
jgi:hypothetical protein